MITTIINYCTNDERFLRKNWEEAKKFSSSIIVSVCDHFFDGALENRRKLNQTYHRFSEIRFVEFHWNEKQLYTPFLSIPADDEERLCLWHSTARYAAAQFAADTEWVLFLDADEIADGERLSRWLKNEDLRSYDAVWFAAHMYRFSAFEQKIKKQYAPLLIRQNGLTAGRLMNVRERFGVFLSTARRKIVDEPFFHHYSWVRSFEELQCKVRTWAKRSQADWEQLLAEARERNRFIDNDPFRIVEPFFDPQSEICDAGESTQEVPKNVIQVSAHDIIRLEVEKMLRI